MRDEQQCGASAKVSEQPLMNEITARILSATDRAADIASRVEDHGHRLFGSQPEGAAGSNEKDSKIDPQGAVDHLFLALANLDQTIARLGSAHNRISRV